LRSAGSVQASADAEVGNGKKENATLGNEKDSKLAHPVFHLTQFSGEHSGLLVCLLHRPVLQGARSSHPLHLTGKNTLLSADAVLILEHSLHLLALPDVGDDGHLEALALQLGLAVDQGPDPDLGQAPGGQDATGGGNLFDTVSVVSNSPPASAFALNTSRSDGATIQLRFSSSIVSG